MRTPAEVVEQQEDVVAQGARITLKAGEATSLIALIDGVSVQVRDPRAEITTPHVSRLAVMPEVLALGEAAQVQSGLAGGA